MDKPPETPPRCPDEPPTDTREKGPGDSFSALIPSDGPWNWLRRTARLWGFLAFVLFILVAFRSVILPFVLALLVAYILAPLVRHLGNLQIRGRRPPRFVWIILVYAVLLGLLGLFFTSFVPRLSNDVKRVLAEAPQFWQQARAHWVPGVADWMRTHFAAEPQNGTKSTAAGKPQPGPRVKVTRGEDGALELDLSKLELQLDSKGDGKWVIHAPRPEGVEPESPDRFTEQINHYATDLVRRSESAVNQLFRLGQKFVLGIFKTITTFILVLMVSAFLLADSERILCWLRNLMPRIYTQDFDNVVALVDAGLSGAIRGQFIICIVNACLTWVGLTLIGIKYPLLLGLLAGVMSLIPIFGSIISSVPIVMVALVSGESGVEIWRGFLILLWIIGIHLLEANLLNPKIMGRAAKIHPVLVIFAVVAGERTYGAVGALLGVPIFSALQALFLYMREKVRGAPRP